MALKESRPFVGLVHDYLTQRGGAERVVLSLARAFPDALVHTSLYEPAATFPEFANVDVRPSGLSRVGVLRQRHRLALPLFAPTFSRMRIDADVAICSSSGWAHGARVSGRKIVYCHTPARWLYQPERYLGGRGAASRFASAALRAPLVRWDKAAAASADLYLANSSVVARRIKEIYGLDAEVLPPPPAVTPGGTIEDVPEIEAGFALCVSRLLPYKNVDAVVRAFESRRGERLVVVGSGPEETALRLISSRNVTFVGPVTDGQLRWLYKNCELLIAASHEDFGLTPLEAATFGKPSAVLRWGGFLDTVSEGETGVFFADPEPAAIATALQEARRQHWDEGTIQVHADRFAESRFVERIRAIVNEAL